MPAKELSVKSQQLGVAREIVGPVAFKSALSLGPQYCAQYCEQSEGAFASRRSIRACCSCCRGVFGGGLGSGFR